MTILVIDDDALTRRYLRQALCESGDGWDVREAATVQEGLALAGEEDVECVVLDYRLPDGDGLACLRQLRQMRRELPVVMATGEGSEAVAVEAMKLGAADYIVKHGTWVDTVPGLVREALGHRILAQIAAEARNGGASPAAPLPLDAAARARFETEGFIVRSPNMLRVLGLIERVAQSDVPVLIEGESGTGKELCARAVHGHGPRASRPFLAVNCAAMPEALLESELFGHVRGAFTGADRARPGLFEQADGGTLFLDEVGEASPAIQAKLLRVLEDGEVRPLGGTTSRRIDVRVVSATNRDLRQEIEAGRFRLDLFYRLRVFPLVVPPLRERRADILPLAHHFLERAARDAKSSIPGFDSESSARLERHAWPGNVRELQNEIRRLVVCTESGARIAAAALSLEIGMDPAGVPENDGALRSLMRQLETLLVLSRLRRYGYRRAETARSLGITRESLWAKLRSLGLLPPGSGEEK